MSHLDNNLALLALRQPQLARLLAQTPVPEGARLAPSRQGPPSLIREGAHLISSVDPLEEGLRLAASAPAGPLVVLGFGLGYHLETLGPRELVVWEPDPGLLRLALEARDLTRVLERVRLVLEPAQLGAVAGFNPFVPPFAARAYPAQALALTRLLQTQRDTSCRPDQPRVLVAPPILGGSLPIAYWCGQALTALGCQVETVPLDQARGLYDLVRLSPLSPERLDQVRAPMVRFLSELTVLRAQEFQPHLVLVMAQAPLGQKAAQDLRALGCVTAYWFIENFRLMTYYQVLAAGYDHFFHIQGPELEQKLDRLGANHAFLPVAAHPPMHRPLDLSPQDREQYGAPVGFMGAGYPNRVRVFSEMVAQGLDLRLWGDGWPPRGPLAGRLAQGGRRLDSQEVSKVYNACSVIINLHASTQAARQVGEMDFVNPRTLEVPACGGFQIVDRARGLETMLAPGREVAIFDRQDQLLEMVRHYLARPEERARMATAARRRVLGEHTYYHRMETLLTRCLGPGRAREKADPPREAAELMMQVLARPSAEPLAQGRAS